MNINQHIFIYIGILLITFMAIALDSTLFWLVAAVALISESVWLCKNKPLDSRVLFLLFLSIVVFAILFLNSYEIRREIGIRPTPSVSKIIRKKL